MVADARQALWLIGRSVEKRLLGRPEILLLDPVWGRRAGHWLKFSTSNQVASVFTSRAHILPPVQGCPGPRSPAPTRAELRLRYSPRAPRHQACVAPGWMTPIIRSYQGESTGSHPNSEVKHPWACSVLRWGTTWESQVSYVFVFCRQDRRTADRRRARGRPGRHGPRRLSRHYLSLYF